MREAAGDEELAVVLPAQFHGEMPPERRGAGTEIHGHIQHASLHDTDKFRLRPLPFLEMEATDDPVAGAALVVLDEIHLADGFGEGLPVEGFEEIPPGVAEDARLQDQQAGNAGFDDIHNLSMHFFRETYQCGTVTPKVCLTRVLSRTEKWGRRALEGNSSLWQGRMSQTVPDRSRMAQAKSYHEQTPSLE